MARRLHLTDSEVCPLGISISERGISTNTRPFWEDPVVISQFIRESRSKLPANLHHIRDSLSGHIEKDALLVRPTPMRVPGPVAGRF